MEKKIIETVKNTIADIPNVVLELDRQASVLLNQFGQAQAMSETLRKSLTDTTQQLLRLGGDLSSALEVQKTVSYALQRNIILSADAGKDLFATMNVTGQDVGKIVENMANVGISVLNTTKEMKKVVDIARESGVNAVIVSDKVLSNMNALNRYNFEGGVSGLAKMAAQATALRIDMSKTLEFAEKVFDPQGAIDVAASLQRLGVAQSDLLDPLRLMELSQNDPAELQNQIAEMSKQFVQMGKDGHFEIMPGAKRQLREIEQAMGITNGDLIKMALGSAELDNKLKQIKFPSSAFTEEDKKMIANMAEMGEGGEYKITTADNKVKNVSELGDEEIKALRDLASKAPPTMEQLAKEQLGVLNSINSDGISIKSIPGLTASRTSMATQAMGTAREITQSAEKFISKTANFKEMSEGIDNLIKGNSGFFKVADYIRDKFKNSLVESQIEFDKLNKKIPQVGEFFNEIMGNSLKSITKQGRDVLKLPGQNIQLLPEDTFAAFTKGSEVLSNLGKNTNNQSAPTSTNSTVDVNHNLNINITAPSHVNTNQLMEMFKDTGVSQALGVAVKEVFNNGGLTAPTSNKQKLMNPYINTLV